MLVFVLVAGFHDYALTDSLPASAYTEAAVGCWRASTQHDSFKDYPGLGRLIPIETLQQPTLELAGVIGRESAPTHGDALK